jgi:alkaline phosphatase D
MASPPPRGATGPPDARRCAAGHEILAIADYRLRYACYRADPDLQRLHQMAPMVALWDDHESANDSWEGGAQNHQTATEGDWNVRRAAAMQVYREWMPVSDEPWKAYPIGTLATLYRTESRLLARTRQADIGRGVQGREPDAALKAFRDGAGRIHRRPCWARRRKAGWPTR